MNVGQVEQGSAMSFVLPDLSPADYPVSTEAAISSGAYSRFTEAAPSRSAPEMDERADQFDLEQSLPIENAVPVVSPRAVRVSMDQELSRPINTVMDANTKEIIQEFPSADVRRVVSKLQAVMGLIFDSEG